MKIDRPRLKQAVARILAHHAGPDNAIRMVDLYRIATGAVVIPGRKYDQTRIIRSLVDQLRAEGLPVCYHAGGYYLARNWEEIEPTLRKLEARALASFRTAANLRRCSVRDLLRHYQHHLPDMEETTNGNR